MVLQIYSFQQKRERTVHFITLCIWFILYLNKSKLLCIQNQILFNLFQNKEGVKETFEKNNNSYSQDFGVLYFDFATV